LDGKSINYKLADISGNKELVGYIQS